MKNKFCFYLVLVELLVGNWNKLRSKMLHLHISLSLMLDAIRRYYHLGGWLSQM